MAYVAPSGSSPTPATNTNPLISTVPAGGSGIVGGATKTAANTAGQNTPAQPSAELSSYLNANQTQANNLAGQVANEVGGQINSAQSAIAPAVNTYTGQLYNQPVATNTNTALENSPSSLTPTQQSQFQTELGASANAPNSAATFEATPAYANLNTNIQNAVQNAGLWNTGNNVADISTALTPFEPGNATSGDSTLDSLLLSQVPTASAQIQAAAAPAANLSGDLNAGANQADTSLQNAIANDQAATQAANQSAQTYATNLTNYLNNAVAQAQATGQSAETQILADLKNGNITPADLSTLGITPAQYSAIVPGGLTPSIPGTVANTKTNPITLANYLSQAAPSTINAEDVATPQNFSDVQALMNLLGGNAPVTPISGATPGTMPTLNTFNYPEALAAFEAANPAPVAPPSGGSSGTSTGQQIINGITAPAQWIGSLFNQGGEVKERQ